MNQYRILFFMCLLGLTFRSEMPQAQTVTDIDGNVYNTIVIGEQTWMQSNLRASHFADGSTITGLWIYNNDSTNLEVYGRLYDWDAAMHNSTVSGTQGACPDGWHIPTDGEWTILGSFLGGNSVAGGKMKETGTEHWAAPNTGATNSSNFSALGAGEIENGVFQFLKTAAVFWSSTQTNSLYAKYRYLSHDDAILHTQTWKKTLGYSIRCVKDTVSTGMQKDVQENKVILFPNPTMDKFKLIFAPPHPGDNHLFIYDSMGVLIIEEIIQDKETTIECKLWPAGIYIVYIQGEKPVKLIKQ